MHNLFMIVFIAVASVFAGMAVGHYCWYLLRGIEDSTYKPEHRFFGIANVLVGLVTAALQIHAVMTVGDNVTLCIYFFTVFVLVGVAIVDWNSFEIPVQFNYVLLALGVLRVITDLPNWSLYIIGMLLVSGIFYILLLLTKGRAMGGGDVKLMFTCGLIVGWKLILLTMILGCILGAIIHSIIMKVSKKEHMLAFGPYLAAGAYIAMCYGGAIIGWYLSFFPQYNVL